MEERSLVVWRLLLTIAGLGVVLYVRYDRCWLQEVSVLMGLQRADYRTQACSLEWFAKTLKLERSAAFLLVSARRDLQPTARAWSKDAAPRESGVGVYSILLARDVVCLRGAKLEATASIP